VETTFKPDLKSNELGSSSDIESYSFPLANLSIKYRLPLLIGALLLAVLAIFTWVTYRGVKEAALESGRERLRFVTQQLASLFQQSLLTMATRSTAAANDPAVLAALNDRKPERIAAATKSLQPLLAPQDANSLRVELWDTNGALIIALPADSKPMPSDLSAEFKLASTGPNYAGVGKLRTINDTLTFPVVVAAKSSDGHPIAFLVRWRKLTATPETMKQFLDLIGSESKLLLGNDDGEFWTDMLGTVPKPPVDLRKENDVVTYRRPDNHSVLAMARPVKGTPWVLLVEFTDTSMLAQARRFLRRMFVIGPIFLLAGFAGALLLSRSFTKPLNSLTRAATAIAGGDYDHVVKVKSKDELGALATAFDDMRVRVHESQNDLENRVRERTAQLEAANAELEAFSYSVSHDLRAPLRAMNGFSRILLENHAADLPADAQRYLNSIRENASHMGRLIDDLLAFSQLGRKELQLQPISSGDLVNRVFEELRPEIGERKVILSVGDLPTVEADPALLRQVYVNLLSNAIKYTRARDEARIEVTASQSGAGSNEIVFCIKDNGAGFDMRYADKLFGVFQRLHRAEEFEGTGVGLATVHRIIQRHGGRIWAEAEVDKGAAFFFTLTKGGGND
jgi:signal transduction histidine kinase